MGNIKTFEGFRKGVTYEKEIKPFQIRVKYEHGDADFTTKRTFSFKTEEEMRKILKVLTKVMNFIPGQGYGKNGYYSPITGNDGGRNVEDLFDRNEFDQYSYYIQTDNHYDQGYASIEGISIKINEEPFILLDSAAAETNLIDLPKIGDIVTTNVNHIAYYGPKFDKTKKYLPNSGLKDYKKGTFKSRVVDCMIDESDYMKWGITSLPYIMLYETDEDVLKSGADIHQYANMIYGWDKNFGEKFGKDEFDDLRIYVL